MQWLRYLFAFCLVAMAQTYAHAHEPLYGFGPHVLFKGGWAPHFTFHYGHDHVETEYALGYGLTRNWTIKGEVPFHVAHGNYEWGGFKFKQKYRLFSRFKPGLSRQISAISTVAIPATKDNPTVVNIGATGGQEALHWYWFFGASYGLMISNQDVKPGNRLTYNATIGYRPMKTSYYKPDIVFFLEGIGNYQQKSLENGDRLQESGGHAWSLAPTFMLTYRNVALRGGVEFGLAETQYLERPSTNYKLILEWHL